MGNKFERGLSSVKRNLPKVGAIAAGSLAPVLAVVPAQAHSTSHHSKKDCAPAPKHVAPPTPAEALKSDIVHGKKVHITPNIGYFWTDVKGASWNTTLSVQEDGQTLRLQQTQTSTKVSLAKALGGIEPVAIPTDQPETQLFTSEIDPNNQTLTSTTEEAVIKVGFVNFVHGHRVVTRIPGNEPSAVITLSNGEAQLEGAGFTAPATAPTPAPGQ
jgi:hypothetical protein